MLGGGIADKLGNRYEAKWTVRQLLDVVGGVTQSLRCESHEIDADGFEFCVERNGTTEWHQTKINGPNGNWTINALHREGVLDAFKSRLAASNADLCVFVSQDPAKDARDLTEEARTATNLQEFERVIANKKLERFKQIQEKWSVDSATAFGWLQRCVFRTESEKSVESAMSHVAALYFGSEIDLVFPILSNFIINRLNISLSTDYVRNEIRNEEALAFKDWNLDPTLKERLTQETRAYLDTYTPFGVDRSIIARSEAAKLFEKSTDVGGPNVIILTGVAGAGKSGIIREFLDFLDAHHVLHLSLRIDHHLSCTTPRSLGNELLGRDESPAVTLKGLAPDRRSILVIDQLDAVSEVSGRNGEVRDGVLRLVDEVRNFRTVVLVLVCRTFDLETDQRLKALKETDQIAHVEAQLLSWEDDVKPLLENRGIATDRVTETQQALLRLPLNLAIFFEVAGDGLVDFSSRNDLFRRLIERKSRLIRANRNVAWELMAPLHELATCMSEAQRLNAQEDVLVQYGGALDFLCSENLVIRSRGKLNFFHESFFDYVFARGFSARKQSIVSLLNASEQHLFRRTQVRQILETLRQSDEARYLRELRELLNSNSVRYHIKVAAAQWLGSLTDPMQAECDIVLELDDANDTLPPLVRYATFSSVGWFDLLLANGWFATILTSTIPDRERAVLWRLSNVAAKRPNEVARLLRDWWKGDPSKGSRLIEWFGFFTREEGDDALVELVCAVIRAKPTGLFEALKGTERGFFFHNWTGKNASGASSVIAAYFEAWFEAHPGLHPFEESDDYDGSDLNEFAKKSPDAFIDGTLSAFVRTIDLIKERETAGVRQYTFTMRAYSGHPFREDAFLSMFRSCLKQVASTDAVRARDVLIRIDPIAHQVCTHIWLETITANAEALADLVIRLLDSPHLFEAGWNGAEWKSFADAARGAFPHLPASEVEKIEQRVLSHMEEIDFAKKICRELKGGTNADGYYSKHTVIRALNRSGREQWHILESIGLDPLGPKARQRLQQLRRKFVAESVPEPKHHEAHLVGAPIKHEKAARMKDEHWLRAIRRYDSDNERRPGHFFTDGGARELACELQELTKAQPARFAKLLLEIPFDAHTAYVAHILSGLAHATDLDSALLERVVLCAHAWPSRPFGSEIASLIKSNAYLGESAALFDVLAWYVEYGEANSDEVFDSSNIDREIATIAELLSREQGLHLRGINGARGSAAEALGAVIWRVPAVVDRAWDVLERRAAHEPLVSVRCCLIAAAVPLFNHDRARCAALVDRLSSPLDAYKKTEQPQAKWWASLITREGLRIHWRILFATPEVGRRLICRLLRSRDENARAFGAWHIFQMSFRESRYAWLANALAKSGDVYRRLLADVASDAIVNEEYRYRAEEIVRASFDDPDKQVRHQAADVFRKIKPTDCARFRLLASDFVNSKAFDGDAWAFFHALKEVKCNVVDIAIAAAEKVIADLTAHGSQGGRRASDLHRLQEIIREEYVVSEGDPELRRRLLDIIDDMLRMELHGVDSIVNAHER